MKIHNITKDRIHFIMDSGAYGSISKTDAVKFLYASNIPQAKLDSRSGECIIDSITNTQELWEIYHEV